MASSISRLSLAFLALLVLGLSAHAAELTLTAPPVIDNITHSSAQVCYQTTGSVAATKELAFDTTANFNSNHSLAFHTSGWNTVTTGTNCMALSGLVAATPYTVCPLIVDGSGNATICTSSGNANSRNAFTTSALPSPHPALPVAPATFDTSYPTIPGGNTLTVALNCSDAQTKLDAAYSGTYTNQSVKVVMPSFATQTSSACQGPWAWSDKSGTGTVVVATSAEGSLPAPGTRTTPADKNNDFVMCSSGATPVANMFGKTRLVGAYLEPCDSAAASGNGNPRVLEYLLRFDSGSHDLVLDRVNFDARGYPYRVHFSAFGNGTNVAFIDSYWNHSEIWNPWVTTTSISQSSNQIISSSSFIIGTGLATYTIPAFTINQSATTGAAYLYVKTGTGALTYRHSNGTATGSGFTDEPGTSGAPTDGVMISWDGVTDSLSYTAGVFAATSFWSNQAITALQNSGGALQNLTEWTSSGIQGDGSGATLQTWIIQNNYFGVTGFGIFSTALNSPTSDWTITLNEFQSNNNCLVHVASGASSPFVCARRHHFETKNGWKFAITHNTFHDGYTNVNNCGCAIDMKQDTIVTAIRASTTASQTTDYYIAFNNIYNESACFYIAGDTNNDPTVPYTKLIARVQITQNICSSNAYDRSQFYVSGFTPLSGIPLWVEEETEDVILDHNTFYNLAGQIVSTVLWSDRWSEGFSDTNNINYVGSPTIANRGFTTLHNIWPVDSFPSFTTASGSDGTAGLNAAITPNATNQMGGTGSPVTWSALNNIFLSGCALAPTGQCVDATTSGSLVGDLSAQYPASNTWLATGTYGARNNAVVWVDRTMVPAGLFCLSGPCKNGGTDGHDIGVYVPTTVTIGPRISGAARVYGAARP